MLQKGQNWDLFGYDVRQLLRLWWSAWREFLWGYDSPVKARLDEGMRVYSEEGQAYYHAGQPVDGKHSLGNVDCEAVLLPESLVLEKMLLLPAAAASEIDQVMAMEVNAYSPFPDNDTGFGWKLVGRDEKQLRVQLAIVSLSTAMSYLGQQYDCHDVRAREVWAHVGGSVIVLSGFGEEKRLARYNKRLQKVASTLAYCSVLVILIFAAAAGSKYVELQQLRNLSDTTKSEASKAIRMRRAILNANETIVAVNDLKSLFPSPHVEMVRLSQLLGDDAYLIHFRMQGSNLDIRGVADDAAVVVEQLTDESAYARVAAPQAITKYFNSDREQFFLNIELAGDDLAQEVAP
jgi:general secretion pathway protein L